MSIRHRILSALAVATVFLAAPSGAQERVASAAGSQPFVIIVSENSPLRTATRQQLSNLFLKKTTTLPGGREAMPVDLNGRKEARIAFSQAVHKKSVVAIQNYWQQQIFAGKEIPPPAMELESDVVTFVRDNPDAVGYVSASVTLGRGVRVVRLED